MEEFKYIYRTPSDIDDIVLFSDGEFLTRVMFITENVDVSSFKYTKLPIFEEMTKWLDIYFDKKNPSFVPKYKISENISSFRKEVFEILLTIPYGKTISYKDIANIIAKKRGLDKMSSQAVGQAVSSNPLLIIIPCHRVIGCNGNLTGYSAGLNNKVSLLRYESIDSNGFFLPKNIKNKKQ